jgi:hypothetical protein
MNLKSFISSLVGKPLSEQWRGGKAKASIVHRRPERFLRDGTPDPSSYQEISRDESHNLITNDGRDFLHAQGYGTSPGANGLNYIALSNDTVTETATSTTLSNEIVANGLQRAQGTVGHTDDTNETTITKVFTATGNQSAQKAALFTAGAGGTMNHVLGFTQRNLISGDTLTVEFTITLG